MSTLTRSMQQLPQAKRPRERLLAAGVNNLTQAELLAVILGSGTTQRNVLSLAKQIMTKFGTQLITTKMQDLTSIHGIGPIQAGKILAVVELGKRNFSHQLKPRLLQPEDVLQQVGEIRSSNREQFLGLYLSGHYELLAKEILAVGRLNTQRVEARDVFYKAVQLPCRSLILVHNHPSGNPRPSQDDLLATTRLKAAGEILGINVLDHLIVTATSYLSFQQEGIF